MGAGPGIWTDGSSGSSIATRCGSLRGGSRRRRPGRTCGTECGVKPPVTAVCGGPVPEFGPPTRRGRSAGRDGTPAPERLRAAVHSVGLSPEAEGVGWRRGWDRVPTFSGSNLVWRRSLTACGRIARPKWSRSTTSLSWMQTRMIGGSISCTPTCVSSARSIIRRPERPGSRGGSCGGRSRLLESVFVSTSPCAPARRLRATPFLIEVNEEIDYSGPNAAISCKLNKGRACKSSPPKT